MDGSDRYTSQMSEVSVDAEAWVDDRSQDRRSSRDDPSGARPRTTGSSGVQPSSLSGTQQLYTGRDDLQQSTQKSPPRNLTRDEFITEHFHKLSKELKVGYYDVMVLYSENDYEDAEKFRAHLENDIFPDNPGKIKAVLYDGPELEGLSASKLQHLDGGFQRCTFTFVYLTKQFVECDWCNLSSETCLMEAIYNKEKKWCVVPVYTVQRNKADFRIPMGLNSLKGINYYNADDFYRRGVKRLIGDKIIKREENELKLHNERYNYLVRKVKEERAEESRMRIEHEEKQRMLLQMHMEKEREYYRSRSEQHHGHTMYPSGGVYPKTAGDKSKPPSFPNKYVAGDESQPPSFPNKYVPKLASEDEDMSDLNKKLEAQSMDSNFPSSGPYSTKKDKQQDSRENPSKQNEPSSMEYDDLTRDYNSRLTDQQSQPGFSGAKEIHYHYHYVTPPNEKNEKPQDQIVNINAENVIIGANSQIIADGRKIDLNDGIPSSNSGSRESLNSTSVDRRGSKSDQGSTCFMDNGFPTGQSSVSEGAALGGNSNAVENIDQSECIRTSNQTNLKVAPSSLKSTAQTDVKDSHYEPNIPNNISNNTDYKENIPNTKISSDIENSNRQNFPSSNPKENCVGSWCKNQRPIKLPSKPVSPMPHINMAKVQPLGMQRDSPNTEKMSGSSPEEEETELKNVVDPNQTGLKVGYSSGSVQISTPPQIAPSGCSPDPDDTEVLKPVSSQRSQRKKISETSLEVDGCNSLTSSTEENSNILQKDDLDITAVTSCLDMGYQREQINEALKLLRHQRPGHRHFSVNELLDALNGKTTTQVFDENDGGIVREEEEWETLTRDDVMDGSNETQNVEPDRNNPSMPIRMNRPSTDLSESGSQKFKSKDKSCKLS